MSMALRLLRGGVCQITCNAIALLEPKTKRTRAAEKATDRVHRNARQQKNPSREQRCLDKSSGTKFGPFLKLAVQKRKPAHQPQRPVGSRTTAKNYDKTDVFSVSRADTKPGTVNNTSGLPGTSGRSSAKRKSCFLSVAYCRKVRRNHAFLRRSSSITRLKNPPWLRRTGWKILLD